jgi:hypothetical protein
MKRMRCVFALEDYVMSQLINDLQAKESQQFGFGSYELDPNHLVQFLRQKYTFHTFDLLLRDAFHDDLMHCDAKDLYNGHGQFVKALDGKWYVEATAAGNAAITAAFED